MISFEGFLSTRLNDTLPGRKAQRLMAPSPINGVPARGHYEPQDDNFNNSSVLIPIVSWKEELEVVLTLRAQSIKHGGQISFPGGGREGDESIVETALREAQEEIGLKDKSIHITGMLSPLFVGHSNNMVSPVVAFLHREQMFQANPNEVDEIFTVPISDLSADHHLIEEEWELRGTPYQVPYWNIHRVPLWGATAMILSELLELYKEWKECKM